MFTCLESIEAFPSPSGGIYGSSISPFGINSNIW